MILESGARLDRYIVERVIGEGGMAVVYRARHVHLGTPVALKVLAVPLVAVQQRLLLEGRAQAALRHPNIVAVHDVIDVRGAPGLVMELVEGPTLADLLAEQTLSLEQVDALARGILEGVAAAHAAGIVHRDLKPGNVLLEVRPTGLVAKVTDFGLAKALAGPVGGASPSESGSPVGTPAYMSPEQLTDPRGVDERSDVFALGALLYELLTGRQAFDGAHVLEIYTAIHAGRFRPVEELVPDAPPRMLRAIAGALRVDREQRLPSVAALREVWTGGEDSAPTLSGVRWGELVREAEALARRGREGTPARPVSSGPTVARPPRLGSPAEAWPAEARRTRRAWLLVAGLAAALAVGAWGVLGRAPAEAPGQATAADSELALVPSPAAGAAPSAEAAPDPEPTVAAAVPDPEPTVPAPVPESAPPAAGGGEAVAVRAPPVRTAPRPAPTSPTSPVPAVPAPAAPSPVPTSAPPVEEIVPPGPPTPMARLVVNSRPWSDRILVDGSIPAGLKIPLELPAGGHEVSLRAHDGRTTTQRIELRPDQTLVFCWDFDAQAPCGR